MISSVNLRAAEDPRDVIHQVCEWLSSGEVLAVPTETVYVSAALAGNERAVESLSGPARRPISLALQSTESLMDYVDQISPRVVRLLRRCWPGPVSLRIPRTSLHGLFQLLPSLVQVLLTDETGHVTFRCPHHPILQEVQRLLPCPIILSSETLLGRNPTLGDLDRIGGIRRFLEDSPCRYGELSTEITVTDDGWKISREGVVSPTILNRLSSTVVLFVCTGNTCRSPMAEAIFRRRLAEHLCCSEDELPDRGFIVMSAGVAAAFGDRASSEGVELLQTQGIDLSAHESQPVTERLLNQADHILTMTNSHLHAILSARPDLQGRARLLSDEKRDISDPIGRGPEAYRACANELEASIACLLESGCLFQR